MNRIAPFGGGFAASAAVNLSIDAFHFSGAALSAVTRESERIKRSRGGLCMIDARDRAFRRRGAMRDSAGCKAPGHVSTVGGCEPPKHCSSCHSAPPPLPFLPPPSAPGRIRHRRRTRWSMFITGPASRNPTAGWRNWTLRKRRNGSPPRIDSRRASSARCRA